MSTSRTSQASTAPRSERPSKRREPAIDESGQSEALVNRELAQRGIRLAQVIAGAGVVIAAITYVLWWNWMVSLGIAVVVAFVAVMSIRTDLTEAEYYRISGSRFADGSHRCVDCGHRGIWRHTVYGTNTTLADCSRCKRSLWRE